MYSLADIARGIRNPETAISQMNRRYTHWRNGQQYNPNGIDVFEEDWDTLLIFDACRYDEFARRCEYPGKLGHRISRGSTSPEFIRGNFMNQKLHDVVYISANGWFGRLKDELDAEVHSYQFVERDVMDGMTSHPHTVTEAGLAAAEEHPQKRLIVHYMQPHHPFLGREGQQLDHAKGLTWTVKKNDLSRNDVLRLYRENLRLVTREAKPLVETIPGKTVITADHGNLLGERERPIPVRRFSHPEGIYRDELVKVPWHVCEYDDRKEIVAEPPIDDDYDLEEVTQNLKDLGYRT